METDRPAGETLSRIELATPRSEPPSTGISPDKGVPLSAGHIVQMVFSSLGLIEPDPIADGLLHRCTTENKPKKKNGAYVWRPESAWLWAKNWETSCEKTVQGMKNVSGCMDYLGRGIPPDWALYRKKKEIEQKKIAQKAQYLWKNVFFPVSRKNPYLKKKGIPGLAARETGDKKLVIPIYDGNELVNVQFIDGETNKKRFLRGGKKKGCFLAFSDQNRIFPKVGLVRGNDILCIAEGYATGVSIHVATGLDVVCAFDCGNYLPVAQIARRRFPQKILCFCADYDQSTRFFPNPGGVGVKKAEEAAALVQGCVALPYTSGHVGDFNDLYLEQGSGAVREALALPLLSGLPRGAVKT